MAVIAGTSEKKPSVKRTKPATTRAEGPTSPSTSGPTPPASTAAPASPTRSTLRSSSGGTSTSPSGSGAAARAEPSTTSPAPTTPTPTTGSNSNSAYDRGLDFALGDIDFDTEPAVSYAYDEPSTSVAEDSSDAESPGSEYNTLERDGEWINPSDAHLYELAEQAEADAAAAETEAEMDAETDAEVPGSEYNTVERDGEWINPSDVHLYELAEQAEANAAEANAAEANQNPEEEQFVLDVGDPDNPFAENRATAVEVTPWDGTDGQPNDHIEGILLNQGFTEEQIYAPNGDGFTLVDQVAQANELSDPNVIHAGQNLVVPTTAPPSPPLEDTIVNEGFPGEYDDQLSSVGTDQNETIVSNGGQGHDDLEVFGENGNDTITLDGGEGDDTIYLNTGGGSDQATILGGEGADDIIIDTTSETEQSSDQVRIDGGEGQDIATVFATEDAEVRYDESTGQNTLVVDSGTEVELDGVEQVQVINDAGEEMHYIQTDEGELVAVDPNAPVDPDAPPVDPDAPTVLSNEQALNVLSDNYRWVADPEEGDADGGSSASTDNLAVLAGEEWEGRDNYLDNLTSSINPSTGDLYSDEEAQLRADELQLAAQTLEENGSLTNVLDLGRDNGRLDSEFHLEDIEQAHNLLDSDTQNHLDVLGEQRVALQSHGERFSNHTDPSTVPRDTLTEIADLQDNEHYEAWANGEIELDEFLDRDGTRGSILENLLATVEVPEGFSTVEIIDELIEAAHHVNQDGVYRQISAADGEHVWSFGSGPSLSLDDDLEAVAGWN